jgi:vacuolar-type H+-ATPase subunit F/Vma7
MTTSDARLVVISPEELVSGFRLAGVDVEVADDGAGAEVVIRHLLRQGERGVIAVYAPFFAAIDEDLQRRLRASVSPVVVELPTGIGAEPDHVRRTRLANRLQRAIGYHITFGDDES